MFEYLWPLEHVFFGIIGCHKDGLFLVKKILWKKRSAGAETSKKSSNAPNMKAHKWSTKKCDHSLNSGKSKAKKGGEKDDFLPLLACFYLNNASLVQQYSNFETNANAKQHIWVKQPFEEGVSMVYAREFDDYLIRSEKIIDVHIICAEYDTYLNVIEDGLSLLRASVNELAVTPCRALKAEEQVLVFVLAWSLQQLQVAYTSILSGNYSAAAVSLRAAFEGHLWMRKYTNNPEGANQWLYDFEFQDKQKFIIDNLKEDKELRDLLYLHYRMLSKLAHPHTQIRSLFVFDEEETSVETVRQVRLSCGADYNRASSWMLLNMMITHIGWCLKAPAKVLKDNASQDYALRSNLYKIEYDDVLDRVGENLAKIRDELLSEELFRDQELRQILNSMYRLAGSIQDDSLRVDPEKTGTRDA